MRYQILLSGQEVWHARPSAPQHKRTWVFSRHYSTHGEGDDAWPEQVNDPINLESDLIGKYVERLLQERGQLPKSPISIDTDYLRKRGLI